MARRTGHDGLGQEDLAEPGTTPYVIELEGRGRRLGPVVGRGGARLPACHDRHLRGPGRHDAGVGTDAVRTLARHLITDHGHHRIEIDPAADNDPAIRCYTKVGFRPVGIRRRSERGTDGSWHDALLMDLLAEELIG